MEKSELLRKMLSNGDLGGKTIEILVSKMENNEELNPEFYQTDPISSIIYIAVFGVDAEEIDENNEESISEIENFLQYNVHQLKIALKTIGEILYQNHVNK